MSIRIASAMNYTPITSIDADKADHCKDMENFMVTKAIGKGIWPSIGEDVSTNPHRNTVANET